MRLILLYGMPATGKMTVARQLVDLTGYKLFHNHMVVDLLLSLFDFGSEPFVDLREQIWLSVFARAAQAGLPGLIFTFCPERSVTPAFVPALYEVVAAMGGQVKAVELTCPLPELKSRIGSASRHEYGKLTSLELFEQLYADGVFDATHMPVRRLTLDTSLLTPAEAAARIADTLAP